MDKYEYLYEDLGYKPGVVGKTKFEYSPLGEALNKGLKKDDKANKVITYDNDLKYDFVHNFNKYSVSNFNKIPSTDSKFETLNNFYKYLKKLNDLKSQTANTKGKKITVMKNASLQHDKLVDIYKKEYNHVCEIKDKDWRLKHDYKNLKDLNY